jgi:hypothetical protein
VDSLNTNVPVSTKPGQLQSVRNRMTEAGSSALKLVDEQVQQNIRFIEAMLLNLNQSRPAANPSEPTGKGRQTTIRASAKLPKPDLLQCVLQSAF